MKVMCETLEVSASGFYAWKNRPASQRKLDDEAFLERLEDHFEASKQTYGTARLKRDLAQDGFVVSRARIGRLMKQAGLVAKAERKRPRKVTTTPDPHLRAPANLVGQDFRAVHPNEVWLADITYVATSQGWLYVATVMDMFSRMIVGWSVKATLATELVLDALMMALSRRRPGPGLVHHSDRGSQYASGAYQELLSEHQMVCSMSGRGNCYDNAPMESFFGTFKIEVDIEAFKSLDSTTAKMEIFKYIEVFYNRKRRHSSIGYMSPSQFEEDNAR